MSNETDTHRGMGAAKALKLEYAIIGLGVLALLLIFQPFNITLFTIGCILVVLAGLINNLLPLAQPSVSLGTVGKVAMVVAMIFCITLLVSIFAAYLYGVFFLNPPDPNTVTGKAQLAAKPWYMHSFTWTIAAIAVALAALITVFSRRKG
jgi:cytochrome c biogenesis factor